MCPLHLIIDATLPDREYLEQIMSIYSRVDHRNERAPKVDMDNFLRRQEFAHEFYITLGKNPSKPITPYQYITMSVASPEHLNFGDLKEDLGSRIVHIGPLHPDAMQGNGILLANVEPTPEIRRKIAHLILCKDGIHKWGFGNGLLGCLLFFFRHHWMHYKPVQGFTFYIYYVYNPNKQFVNYHQLKFEAWGTSGHKRDDKDKYKVIPEHKMLTFHHMKHDDMNGFKIIKQSGR